MKQNKLYIIIMLLISSYAFFSCSDEYMESMNTDTSKAETIDPNAQLTTAILQTYGDLEMVQTYRSYLYAFTQQLMGCWNTTNYGGRHTLDNNEMSHIWKTFYPVAIKNLVDAESRTAGDEEKVNINAAISIYKIYLMSVLTDIYGDIPYSEAGRGYIDGISTPQYDTQESIYYNFFTELKTATMLMNAGKDKITGDVIFKGDVSKWIKLGNSLRLRYAMRISDVEPEKAQKEFEDVLSGNCDIINDINENALITYIDKAFSFGQESYTDYRGNALSQLLFGNDPANNPGYLCSTFFNELYNSNDPRTFRIGRFYYDGLMSSTSSDNRVDLTQEMIDKNITFQPRDPGAYSWEPWPAGYESDILKTMSENNPSINYSLDRETEPKLASNFLKGDNPGVIMTSAEVKFLLAEAKLKGWNVEGDVYELYKSGVREAMDFLTYNYKCEEITDEEFDKYMAENGIGYTNEQKKESINKQAWILHFTNPTECWANLRRSGYPRLKSPEEYGYGQFLTGGNDIPVRLCYPVLESSYNKDNYQKALDRMGGENSWHTPVWWDK